ncbi:exopolysaccharide biosynthesis protein [Brevundimonas subvibrioides]|uniref:exopolysaccharide biosynthesis protein n=1 Tax=Brevundimonas subvibrioides TaxID=74313 RepID=UPI0022B2B4A6|nr:exopolysaccharide biosynthesis protein [Brevundimonas subvibrioides]
MPSSQTHARTFSEVLEDLGHGENPKLSLHEVVDRFGERGFGALILVLALVAMIPWPPGGKALFALAIILMAVQLTLLRHEVWLPAWAGKASVSRGFYRSASGKIMGMVRKFESLSRPRLLFMTGKVADILIGVVAVLMALMMGTSAPLIDVLPDLALVLFGLGLMARDGVILIGAWVMVGVSILTYVLAWESLVALFHGVQHTLHLG